MGPAAKRSIRKLPVFVSRSTRLYRPDGRRLGGAVLRTTPCDRNPAPAADAWLRETTRMGAGPTEREESASRRPSVGGDRYGSATAGRRHGTRRIASLDPQ
jgi:hypothetical protein